MNSVFRWLRELDLNVSKIRDHVVKMQELFIGQLKEIGSEKISISELYSPVDAERRGNFLTFKTERAGEIHELLKSKNVLTDYRNDRLRFGFAIYHDEEDIIRLIDIINKI